MAESNGTYDTIASLGIGPLLWDLLRLSFRITDYLGT